VSESTRPPSGFPDGAANDPIARTIARSFSRRIFSATAALFPSVFASPGTASGSDQVAALDGDWVNGKG
jgi:hypothetical protein